MAPLKFSVVIPSKTASNLIPCVEALRKHEPGARIIIIDDGLALSAEELQFLSQSTIRGDWAFGPKPFIFARNVNVGIRAAGELAYADGVVILNDDAILQTPGGFSLLAQSAEDNPEYGLIASTCNNVGNRNQWPRGVGLREDPRIVCFVAVYIPRSTIDAVGLLDERFTGYGFEDDDYCYRVRQAGLKIGIHDGCYVDHGSLKSTFRGDPRAGANLEAGRKIFVEKWGAHPL